MNNDYREGCLKALELLESMPQKRLIRSFYRENNCYCAVGAIAHLTGNDEFFSCNLIDIHDECDSMIRDIASMSIFNVEKFGIPLEVLEALQVLNDRWFKTPELRYEFIVATLKEFNSNSKYVTLFNVKN